MQHDPHAIAPAPKPEAHPWALTVAPMMDWTDRHCRYFHRLLTRRARLYTEMVTTGALLHGDQPRHLDFDAAEHPLALQLGGSDAADLAACARLAQQWGYDEVNLNCGCPSDRVQRGAFGACLMLQPQLVRDAVAAMQEAVGGRIPITVKHRIGLDQDERYGFVRDFVGTVAEGGCRVFIVHARNAWLQGLSPKENREVPALRPQVVLRLKADFPGLRFVMNGGIRDRQALLQALGQVGGAMVGRQAYHEPAWLGTWDALLDEPPDSIREGPVTPQHSPDALAVEGREAIEEAMVGYMARQCAQGVPWSAVARHMLGLYNGLPGARRWRQVWSDHRLKQHPPAEVARAARAARMGAPATRCAPGATVPAAG